MWWGIRISKLKEGRSAIGKPALEIMSFDLFLVPTSWKIFNTVTRQGIRLNLTILFFIFRDMPVKKTLKASINRKKEQILCHA